ncbi:DEAD/DEAH box helicase family protein [Methylotetracoccus oryzae]|uniref:DEAD/DEAH box helicase family protein n=1 Tax=Methylotetracoccus oryzae TaxID=1919059 RepID=UPI0011184FC5|nr:DEAD/DEAH box helicase family protein [Methylotetracoccus oryzae]
MNLSEVSWPSFLETSSSDLVRDFFAPALSSSVRYDRGVGFFSSGWLRANALGMAGFAEGGGRARWITSPVLDPDDWDALLRGDEASREPILRQALLRNLPDILIDIESNTLNALAWMVADRILEFRLALPANELAGGEFHDKFGIFTDSLGQKLSFNGSYNDSIQGLRNYESIKVFVSWKHEHKDWVVADQKRFDTLWDNGDPNVRIYRLPEAVKAEILKLRSRDRPYEWKPSPDDRSAPSNLERYQLWPHQIEAREKFLLLKRGVIEMATGTGKTRLAVSTCDKLLSDGRVDTVIISADGTDLLDQWYGDLLDLVKGYQPRWAIHRHYDNYKERDNFLLNPARSILLTSRLFLPPSLKGLTAAGARRTILIHDEVHRLGSPANRDALAGLSSAIGYRMGLSATPEREYDVEGNKFISAEIGDVLFRFSLEEAISQRILSPFDYHPIPYEPSEEDRTRIQAVYAKKAARKREGNPMSKEEVWTEIAKVYKTSKAKIPPFREFIALRPDLLNRCIVFVETKEYGEEVLEIIHSHHHEFHTYFAEEDSETLKRFANGELECLLTCHRLSEGIDIRSLSSVILFSSARARLETIQRMGRCLRVDPENPGKRAHIIDFVRNDKDITADAERAEWLVNLSKIQPQTEVV